MSMLGKTGGASDASAAGDAATPRISTAETRAADCFMYILRFRFFLEAVSYGWPAAELLQPTRARHCLDDVREHARGRDLGAGARAGDGERHRLVTPGPDPQQVLAGCQPGEGVRSG